MSVVNPLFLAGGSPGKAVLFVQRGFAYTASLHYGHTRSKRGGVNFFGNGFLPQIRTPIFTELPEDPSLRKLGTEIVSSCPID